MHVVIYTALLIPLGMLPFWLGVVGFWGCLVAVMAGVLFTYQAIQLFRTCDVKEARALLFGSFAYLPVVLVALVLDRIG